MGDIDLNKFVRSTNHGMGLPVAAAPDMAELQARVSQQKGNGVAMLYSGHDQYGLAFRFFIHDEKNQEASKLAKCELFDQVECREVFVDKKTKVVQRVTQKIKDQWPEEYRAFQERKEAPGTPLDKWGVMKSNEIPTLVNMGIFTVEQFSMQPGDKIKKLPQNFRDHFESAQQFVARKAGLPAVKEMADRFIALERENAKLKEDMDFLMAQSKQKQTRTRGPNKPKAAPKGTILPASAGING